MKELLRLFRKVTAADLEAYGRHIVALEGAIDEAIKAAEPEATRKASWLAHGPGPADNAVVKFMAAFEAVTRDLLDTYSRKKAEKIEAKGHKATSENVSLGAQDIQEVFLDAMPKKFKVGDEDIDILQNIFDLYKRYTDSYTFDVIKLEEGKEKVPPEKEHQQLVMANIWGFLSVLYIRKEQAQERQAQIERKIFKQNCQDYLTEIEQRILAELKAADEKTYFSYKNLTHTKAELIGNRLVYTQLSPVEAILDDLDTNAVLKHLSNTSDTFKINLEKYKAGQALKATLTSEKPVTDQLNDYVAAREVHRPTLVKNADSTEKKFLKVLFSVVSCLAGVGLILTPILWLTVWKPEDKKGVNLAGKGKDLGPTPTARK